jgi:starvation-inducible DNA-binding protein
VVWSYPVEAPDVKVVTGATVRAPPELANATTRSFLWSYGPRRRTVCRARTVEAYDRKARHKEKSMTEAKIKTYPPASQLATPTDLASDEVQAVSEAVNPLIADALALYTKTKNYHWHLSGSHFRDYHLLFDEQAEAILGSVDILAERIRKIGGTTLRSVSHISELQTITDDNDDFVPAGEMVRRLLKDNRHMAEMQRAAIPICDENRDSPTGNILQEILDETEKRIWFLYEIAEGENNTA